MASRFEIVDEEYIEELKDKSENENTNSTEFSKSGRMKKLASKFRRKLERCPRPTIVAVLSIQKFSTYFVLCYQQVIAMDPRKIKD